jgi:hypothetical protein
MTISSDLYNHDSAPGFHCEEKLPRRHNHSTALLSCMPLVWPHQVDMSAYLKNELKVKTLVSNGNEGYRCCPKGVAILIAS